MPYTSIEDLPENVKKLPETKQRQWMHVFNSAFNSCQAKGGEDCEGSAFAQANGVVFREGEMTSSVLFTDLKLPDLLEGRPFDGVAPGVFTDMYGRKVELKVEDFPVYVRNTQELIEASTTESGELVGLPIDATNHDKGDAAGWIVGAELQGSVIRLTPRWTETGIESIRKGVRRMFSPTINLSTKTVLGGTLTNWPATRDSRGKVLLRPIELSSGLHAISDSESLMKLRRVSEAFQGAFSDCELESIREGYAIVKQPDSEDLFKVTFSSVGDSGEISFTARESWEKLFLDLPDTSSKSSQQEGESSMTTIELSQEQLLEIAQKVVELTPKPSTAGSDETLASLLSLEGLSEEAKKQRKTELQGQLAAIRKQAELEYREEMARLAFENSMTELSQKLTQGFEGATRGLRVAESELKDHLMKLTPEEAKFWGDLMLKTSREGFIEFSELGSGAQAKGTKALPEEIAKKLSSKELEVSDLSNPVLNLGDLDQYDLSAWKK